MLAQPRQKLFCVADVRIVAAAGVALTKTAPFWHPSVVAGGFQCI